MASVIPKKIALITASTRTPRIGPHVTTVVKSILDSYTSPLKPSISVLDVKDFNLPVFDDEAMPATVPEKAEFKHEYSKKWSAAIK